jgi:hypothetical protein
LQALSAAADETWLGSSPDRCGSFELSLVDSLRIECVLMKRNNTYAGQLMTRKVSQIVGLQRDPAKAQETMFIQSAQTVSFRRHGARFLQYCVPAFHPDRYLDVPS